MIEMVVTPKSLQVPKRLKLLVRDSVKRHAWNIGVSHYSGDILYMENDKDSEIGTHVIAEVTADRRYLQATFKIYPEAIKRWKSDGDPFIENTIAHEVAHLATQHLYDVATSRYCDDGEMKDAWETLTEVVGKLSVRLDKKNRDL